jgi:hypothetical protein
MTDKQDSRTIPPESRPLFVRQRTNRTNDPTERYVDHIMSSREGTVQIEGSAADMLNSSRYVCLTLRKFSDGICCKKPQVKGTASDCAQTFGSVEV